MTSLATAFVTIRPDTTGFGARLSSSVGASSTSAGRSAGARFTSAFKSSLKLGAVAAGAFAVLKGGEFLKDSIGAASDLGETMSKVGVVFGKGADDVEKFASDTAKSLGQSKQEALDAAATFGTMGKVAGLTGQENAKFSTSFTKLASDMASFSNTSPQDAVEALGAALRGEAEPIRRYGVLLDEATLKAEASRIGLVKVSKDRAKISLLQQDSILAQKAYNDAVGKYGKNSYEATKAQAKLSYTHGQLKKATEGSIPALTQSQKVLAARSAIMRQTSDAQGDFARTSGGLANKQRILSAQIEDVKTKVGAALLPAVTKLATKLSDDVVPAVTDFIDEMEKGEGTGGKVRDILVKVGNALKATGGFLVDHKKEVAAAAAAYVVFKGVMFAFKVQQAASLLILKAHTVGTIEQAVVSRTAAAAAKVWAAGQWILNAALSANPIGLVVTAIGLLTAAFVVAYKKSETFRNVVDKTWDKVKTATQIATLFVVDKVLWLADKMLGAMATAFSWVPGLGPKLRTAAAEVAAFREQVNNEMDKIRDEKVYVSVNVSQARVDKVNNQLGDNSTMFASGGPVPLARGAVPGKDSVRALLMPGEHVLTTDEVKKAGGHKAIFAIREGIKSGMFKKVGDVGWDPGVRGRGKVRAYAKGGPVFDVRGSIDPALMGGIAAVRDHAAAAAAADARAKALEAARRALKAAAAAGGAGNPLPGGGSLTPAQIARGQAFAQREAGKPYIWGGVGPAGYDCSGFVSAVLNAALGVGPYFRRGSTGTMPWAGSKPGTGSFTYGYFQGDPGHTAGNIGGLPFESTNGSTRVGAAARSVLSFPHVYHYDRGGLARGVGFMEKKTLRPERVLSPRQTDAFERLVDKLDAGGGGVSVHVDRIETRDDATAMRKLREEMRKAHTLAALA